MLDNIPKIIEAQDMQLSLMIDGVPKILVNRSTIWNAGTTTLSRDSQDHVPRCGTYVGEEAFIILSVHLFSAAIEWRTG